MINVSDFSFLSSDGHSQIHCRMWKPDAPFHAVVQIVHGVAEHIARYDEFARFLADQGYVAVGDDHLGHGQTAQDDSEIGWISETDGWSKLVKDEKTLHDMLFEQFPGTPMVLFGHSMGSFISRTYLGDYPEDYNACILSGTGHTPPPLCRVGQFVAKREIKRHGSKYKSERLQNIAFGGYLKGIQDPIGKNDWVCRDEDVLHRFYEDPLCGFTGSAGLMYDMLGGLFVIASSSHMAKMNKKMPILFVSGEADPVGGWGKSVREVESRFRSAGMEDVTANYYPDMRHEVLNEIGKENVWNDILHWMEEKIRA